MRNKRLVRTVSATFFFIFLTIGWLWGNQTADAKANQRINTTFSCSDSETDLQNKGVTFIENNGRAIYVAYQQVSIGNHDPIVARFDNGGQVWCRTDYETTNDDNRAMGVYWNGTDDGLYLTFSATGTQGSSNEDLRRFSKNGWLTHYTDGSPNGGGGAKVSIIARVDPSDGEIQEATFVTAMLSSNRTNSLLVTGLTLEDDNILKVEALSWYSPRNPDKSRMSCLGSSPFAYTLRLTTDLSTAISSSAENCTGNSTQPPSEVTVSPEIGFVGDNIFVATVGPDAVQLPITFTWRINGQIVRTETVNQRTDTFEHSWGTPVASQMIEVTVENSKSAELSLAPVSSGRQSFAVVEAKRIFLPIALR